MSNFHSCSVGSFLVSLTLVCVFWGSGTSPAQSGQAVPAQTPASGNRPTTDSSSGEITSRDEASTFDQASTFKVNVNLILVRVVVRDSKGHVIGNLHKDDFQLFDDRKPQLITQFSAEESGAQLATMQKTPTNQSEKPQDPSKLPAVPEHFIAYVFDDVHLKFGDLAQVRDAAIRHLESLGPTERAAIFSTSGQTTLDFTDDRAKLRDALLHLQSRPVTGTGMTECPDVSYYMADLIQNKQDTQALQAATQDALVCAFQGDQRFLQAAQALAQSMAAQQLTAGDTESHLALAVLKEVIRRVSMMPGQRSIVLLSPGFLTPHLEFDYTEIIDRALRSQVTVSAMDARGLYTMGDASKPGPENSQLIVLNTQYAIQEASDDSEIMAILADGTGGSFFKNSNDLDEGFKRVASTPESFYVLGFAPQNLKLDGSFHSLKVTLKSPEKLTLQARRGYFAPKHAADASQQAKQEIEDALFSQEEMHNLPVELHTQFFKSTEADAKLTVLAHVDVKRLHFRKADGRNNEELTVVSAVFNRNGNFIQGIEKKVTMRLRDDTLANKLASGITLKTSFDVAPGSYLVRLVVRDMEAQLLSAENDAVRIP